MTNAHRALFAYWLVLMYASASFASPGTFVTALPVARDQWLIRFNAQPTLGTISFSGAQFPLTNAYGITSRLALFVGFNQGFGSLTQATPDGPLALSSAGFGDISAFVRYTLFRIDRPGSTLRIAPLAGLWLPTGSNTLQGSQGLLPGTLQTGSGTVDPYVGVTMGYNNRHWGMAADSTFRRNAVSADGFSPGSQFRADAQFEVILFPPFTTHMPEEGLPKELVISLESNYVQDGRSHTYSALSLNSGGRAWKQDLILELGTLHGQAGVGFQLPVLQDLPGTARVKQRFGVYVYYERYLAVPRHHGKAPQ